MENALLIALSRQTVLRRSLDVIANNVANMNTAGYKTDGIIFEEFMMDASRGTGFSGRDRRASFVNDRATWTDMRTGGAQQTGNPLDIAIDGNALLVVQTPRGERYTRNGALQVNSAGELVTSQGHQVLGEAGPIIFQRQDRDISITREGRIAAGEATRGKLRLVEFAANTRLRKDGENLFVAPAGAEPQNALQPKVVQGALEKSNVHPVLEMTRMIEATRAYTSIATLTEQQGQLRKTAIERLAEVPN